MKASRIWFYFKLLVLFDFRSRGYFCDFYIFERVMLDTIFYPIIV
jgi:hypothetical protein